MKNKSLINLLIAAGIAAFITACGTEHDFLSSVQPASGARIKFIHAAPDAPGVALYVNDKKFSGVLTTAPATPGTVTYGNVFPGSDYATVEAGAAKARLIVPASGATAETTVFSGTVPVEADKYYSVFATGLAPTYGALVLEDKIPAFNERQIFFRIVNLVPGSTATATFSGVTLADKVEYGKSGDFTPYNVPDTFKGGSIGGSVTIKNEGPGGVAATTTFTFTGYTGGRAVTLVMRGVLPATPTGTSKYPVAGTSYFNR